MRRDVRGNQPGVWSSVGRLPTSDPKGLGEAGEMDTGTKGRHFVLLQLLSDLPCSQSLLTINLKHVDFRKDLWLLGKIQSQACPCWLLTIVAIKCHHWEIGSWSHVIYSGKRKKTKIPTGKTKQWLMADVPSHLLEYQLLLKMNEKQPPPNSNQVFWSNKMLTMKIVWTQRVRRLEVKQGNY